MAQRPGSLTECPKSPDQIHFATYWYRLPNVPRFLVCSKCYNEEISRTQFATFFEMFYLTPTADRPATCNFNCWAVEKMFNDALQSGYGNFHSLATLETHARTRSHVRPCPGTDGIAGGNGVRWFGIPQLPDFMACEACYLDYISGSSFCMNFRPYPVEQRPDQIWACDIAIMNVRRHLLEDSKRSDWTAFINATAHRLSLPRCEGSELSLTRTNWYTPVSIPNMLICETCFLDEISMFPHGITSQFCELRSKWTCSPPVSLTGKCAFSKISVQICSNQLLEKDFGRWLHLVSCIVEMPVANCGTNLSDRYWYMLVNPWTHHATDFGFCEGCYLGCIEASNNSHLFRRERIPGVRSCDCSSANPRLAQSIPALTEFLMTRDTNKLINWATDIPALHMQSQAQSYYSTASQHSVQPQQAAPGYADAAAMSQKLAQQHAMRMGMMNMTFAANSMHNAAMSGITNQGSSYATWNDPKYNAAQYSHQQAQNQFMMAPMAPGWLGKQ